MSAASDPALSEGAAPASETRLLLVASAAYAVGIFSSWTIPLQVDDLMSRFSKSAPHAGLLATSQLVVLGLTAFAAPTIGRRYSPARLGTAGCFLSAAGFVLAAQSGGFEPIVWLAFALCGIGQGLAGAAGSALAAVSRDPLRRFSQVASAASAYSAIWLFAVPQVRPLVSAGPVAFYACAVATLACGLIMASLRVTPAATGPAGQAAGSAILKPGLFLALAGSLLIFAPAQAVWSFSDQLAARMGMTSGTIGTLLFASTIAGVVGPLLAPRLVLLFGAGKAILITVALTGVACVGGSLTSISPVFMVCILAVAFLQMAITPMLFELVTALDPSGRTTPLVYGAILFGCSAGPLLGGVAFEPSGHRLAGVGLVLCALSGLALFGALRRTRVPPST